MAMPKASAACFNAVFGSQVDQKLHNIKLILPSAKVLQFGVVQNSFWTTP
jgi:hypothetical protein